ncbi:MAG: hypothetical protein AAGA31_21605, partial [Bacteroidota bacterium]
RQKDVRMRQLTLLFLLSISVLGYGQSGSQANEIQKGGSLFLETGLQHTRMLDRHASPLSYAVTALQNSLGYENRKPKRLWSGHLTYSLGQFQPANGDLPRYEFDDSQLNSYLIGFGLSYLRRWRSNENSTTYLGASLTYEMMVDFEGIANFPWLTGQGDIGLDYRREWKGKGKSIWHVAVGLPLVGHIVRQPYNFIPRRDNEEPGVGSALAVGSKIVTWDSYQKINFEAGIAWPLSDRWTLRPTYRFQWFRYTDPKPISAYRHELVARINYHF